MSVSFVVIAGCAVSAFAQQQQPPQQEPATREAAIEDAQAEKAKDLHPYVPGKAEAVIERLEENLTNGVLKWHPFFDNAYAGGGFTLGAGYATHVSPYNILDVRGSWTFANYKRIEAEFLAPRLFHRRGKLSVLGGWREATEVGFFGIGPDTQPEAETNYSFRRPYGSATLTLWPTRKLWMLRGGAELTQWEQRPGEGTNPSVETVYTPATLPGLGAQPTYLHTDGTFAFDWRTSPGYARRGGYYGVTVHDFADTDDAFGFRQIDYEAIQHVPILREAWVISLRSLVKTALTKDGQQIPFFMLPSLGGGSNLRGFSSWRYRDQNSLLVQAEWRIMANRFLDTAVFFDAGKVAAKRSDLDFKDLQTDYGFGVRFHGPFTTPLRIEVARGREGLHIIFSSSEVF